MLKSENRLKKRKEFAYLYNNGSAKHTANLTLVYLPTRNRAVIATRLRVAFTVLAVSGAEESGEPLRWSPEACRWRLPQRFVAIKRGAMCSRGFAP